MKAHRHSRRHSHSRRHRAAFNRTPWLAFLHPLIGLPPTWGMAAPNRHPEERCSERS